jgi:hypothetical protein
LRLVKHSPRRCSYTHQTPQTHQNSGQPPQTRQNAQQHAPPPSPASPPRPSCSVAGTCPSSSAACARGCTRPREDRRPGRAGSRPGCAALRLQIALASMAKPS